MRYLSLQILTLVLFTCALVVGSSAYAQVVINVESDTPDPDNPGRFLNLTHRELQVAVDEAEEFLQTGTSVVIDLGGTVAIGRTVFINSGSRDGASI